MSVLGRWQLPPVHLDIVLKYLRIDGLTLPISTRSFGHTADQFAAIGKAELPNMEASGVVVDDEVVPPLVDALKTLATPYLWVDSMWFPEPGSDHCWRAVAVFTEGNRVVLGVQAPSEDPKRGGLLTVEVHQNAPLPGVVLGTLPPAKPGAHGPIRVPHSSLQGEQVEDYDPSSMMQTATRTRGSSGDQQVELYEKIGKAPHVRLGQIAANMRDQHGRRRRTPVVSWFDNVEPDGRYLDRVERGSTGEPLYALLPADARLIGNEINSLINQVRQG
ncbi:ESX secretion-associated protein EspG [Saccharopolyspora mangrovi]|uniref:ESX secretion-associated protein EspG n=1 Tax=Saccharopolyspora mangrovi TaxID=3082379 RepID=A0ABU6A322_9PSEU|nr:ESX secretion-associated protein EspG [Saccharopolyspora sp. S2-29]MEB3365950.1 ESX secretion-associated protein EspG [Saccharopolyspora sp. S2-29]